MNLIDCFPKIVDRTIPISVLQIPPRVFLNWKQEGIIDININQSIEKGENRKTNRRWAYLNLFDALWLLIVKELRAFNIDLKTIRQLKEFLFHIELSIDQIPMIDIEEVKLFLYNNFPEELIAEIDFNDFSIESLLEFIKKTDEDFHFFYTILGSLMTSVILLKQSPSIQLTRLPKSDQLEFKILMPNFILKHSEPKDFFDELLDRCSSSFILNIPIKPLIELILESEVFEKYNVNYDFFNEKEQKVLELLRNDDYKEITIKKGNDGLMHLESKYQLDYKNEKAKEIRRIMGLKEYERIELIQRNDKHIVINKTNKQKL